MHSFFDFNFSSTLPAPALPILPPSLAAQRLSDLKPCGTLNA